MQIKTKTLKSQNNIFHNMMIFAFSYHFKEHLITSESWRLSSEQVYGNISYILDQIRLMCICVSSCVELYKQTLQKLHSICFVHLRQ